MGGMISNLFCLWVRSGFSTATVAASLTFFPPSSTYEVFLKDPSDEVLQNNEKHISEWKRYHRVVFRNGTEKGVITYKLKTKLGNTIPAFLYPTLGAKFTVIFSHGNATDCGAMHERYLELAEKLCVNIFAYEYSGYGTSTGTPSEKNTYADVQAAFDFVSSNLCDNPSKEIILYGQSIGSGPSINLAARNEIAGLIVHSGIASGMRVLTPSRALACLDIFPNVDRIRNVTCPALIIHGKLDREVGFQHGLDLYHALPQDCRADPYWVEKCGHNDIGEDDASRTEYFTRLKQYIDSLDHVYHK